MFDLYALTLLFIYLITCSSLNTFYWISASSEGFAQHWKQLTDMWLHIKKKCPDRQLRMVPYMNSYHNVDMKNYIDFCDFLVLPNGIICDKSDDLLPDQVVNKYKCVTPCVDKNWDCSPYAYGLFRCHNFTACKVSRRPIDFCADDCGLYYGSFTHKLDHFKIRFHPRFQPLYNLIVKDLGHSWDAVHWRRGDQLSERCKKSDFSVNCENSSALVLTLRNLTTKVPVYISTNEANAGELNVLSEAGYIVWSSLSISKMHLNLTSADIFLLELMVMTYAKRFFHWGLSTVPKMVNVARHQNHIKS